MSGDTCAKNTHIFGDGADLQCVCCDHIATARERLIVRVASDVASGDDAVRQAKAVVMVDMVIAEAILEARKL